MPSSTFTYNYTTVLDYTTTLHTPVTHHIPRKKRVTALATIATTASQQISKHQFQQAKKKKRQKHQQAAIAIIRSHTGQPDRARETLAFTYLHMWQVLYFHQSLQHNTTHIYYILRLFVRIYGYSYSWRLQAAMHSYTYLAWVLLLFVPAQVAFYYLCCCCFMLYAMS